MRKFDVGDMLFGWFMGMIIGATTCGSIMKGPEAKFKDTATREGSCVIQERVHEPQYRLSCEAPR